MDIRDLRYFLYCVELGQVGLAADRVGRTQPAVTKAIRRLEDTLDTKLFRVDGRGLALTPMGEALAAHARKLLRGIDDATKEVREVASGQIGHVKLGASPTAADWLLPGALARALREVPDLAFDVKIGLGEVLRRDLRDGLLDFAVAPLDDSDSVDFFVCVLGTDILVPAVRPNHPLLGREIGMEQLAEARWMIPTLAAQNWIRGVYERHNMGPPSVPVQVSTVVGMRRLVAQSDLLTFISRRDLKSGTEGTWLVELDAPAIRFERQFGTLVLKDAYLTMAARRMIEFLSGRPIR